MNTTITKEDLEIVIQDEVSKMVTPINESKKKSTAKAKPSPNPTPSKKNDGKKNTKKKHISETSKSKLKTIIMEELQSILKEAGFGQMVGNAAGNVVNAAKGFAQGVQQGYQNAGQTQAPDPILTSVQKLVSGRDIKSLAGVIKQNIRDNVRLPQIVNAIVKSLGINAQVVTYAEKMAAQQTQPEPKTPVKPAIPPLANQGQPQQPVASGQPNRIGGANV